jgi:hypothetical protein
LQTILFEKATTPHKPVGIRSHDPWLQSRAVRARSQSYKHN